MLIEDLALSIQDYKSLVKEPLYKDHIISVEYLVRLHLSCAKAFYCINTLTIDLLQAITILLISSRLS